MKNNKFVIDTGITVKDFNDNEDKIASELLVLVNDFFKHWDRVTKEPEVIHYDSSCRCFIIGGNTYYSLASIESLNDSIILIYNIKTDPKLPPCQGFTEEDVIMRQKELDDFYNKFIHKN